MPVGIVVPVRIVVVVCLFTSVPASALAETPSVRVPTIAATAAAAADWATTYHALKGYRLRELNPVLRPIDHEPGKMISAGALMDAGLVSGWNLTVGRSKPRLAITGLWVMTAFRTFLAIHNLRNERRAAAR